MKECSVKFQGGFRYVRTSDSYVRTAIVLGSIKLKRNYDLSCFSRKIQTRKNQLLLASASRFQIQLIQLHRKNYEMKIQDHLRGRYPSHMALTLKMILSLYSPQAGLESYVKGSSHWKKLLYQGKLCQNFILPSEEFNRVTHKTSAEPCPSQLPAAPPSLPAHSTDRASKLQPCQVSSVPSHGTKLEVINKPRALPSEGSARACKWQPSPDVRHETYAASRPAFQCQTSTQLSASNISEPCARQKNVQITKFFSFLTPAMMISLSLVAKRSVQQAMVASHGAAESHHERVQCVQWDVWLSLIELPRVEGGPQYV